MYKTKYHQKWIELLAKTEDLDYGTEMTHEEIETIVSLGKDDDKWGYVISMWKKKMRREKMRCVESIHGKGYRIVQPSEHGRLSKKDVKKAQKKMRTASEVIVATPRHLLSEKELIALDNIGYHIANAAAAMSGASKALNKELKIFKYKGPKEIE